MTTATSTITHIFFEVPGVLVDRAELGRCTAHGIGLVMAERYGLQPATWTAAYQRVLADWDSYYADLNLSDDDGLADMWEGLFRTTRALFRLTGTPEPSKSELTALSRELPALAARDCAALYPEVPAVVRQLDSAGLMLGVISYSLHAQIRALLAPALPYFKSGLWGADNSEQFDKDAQRYRLAALRASVRPERCLIVDDHLPPLIQAKRAGMQAIQIKRDQTADETSLGDLRTVAAYVLEQGMSQCR